MRLTAVQAMAARSLRNIRREVLISDINPLEEDFLSNGSLINNDDRDVDDDDSEKHNQIVLVVAGFAFATSLAILICCIYFYCRRDQLKSNKKTLVIHQDQPISNLNPIISPADSIIETNDAAGQEHSKSKPTKKSADSNNENNNNKKTTSSKRNRKANMKGLQYGSHLHANKHVRNFLNGPNHYQQQIPAGSPQQTQLNAPITPVMASAGIRIPAKKSNLSTSSDIRKEVILYKAASFND